tara:strand:+ start:654 stop:1235 length:582 start_codon:yes stop_codon:yes gene_type:complete
VKIIFCIPGKTFSEHFLKSWSKLISELQLMEIEWELVNLYYPIISQARQKCLNKALKKDYNYLMWIDSDIIFEPQDFRQLLSHDKDIISGLYMIQKTPGIYDIPDEYACIGLDGNRFNRFEYDGARGLKQIKANGMGWMLVKHGVFESIKKPFDLESEDGEDITFQIKALKKGYKSYVDTSVIVGHEKLFIIR